MKRSQKNRVRLSIETLEHRDAPAALTVSPPGWVDPEFEPIVKETTASAKPRLETAEVHSGGVVQWSLDDDEALAAALAAAHSHARPFHAEDSGAAVINPNGTISASATGTATHLGKFTLHDTSSIVRSEITPDGDVILHIEGLQANLQGADLEAANGDHLFASFTGSVNFTTGEGTVTFEWTGGTGRFAGATGTTVWQIHLNTTNLTYTAVAHGVINY
jgi:hypothetical protein